MATGSNSHSIYDYLLAVREEKGAGFIVLIDPDKLSEREAPAFAERCTEAGVDAFFIGGSLMHQGELDRYVGRLKLTTDRPIVGFPGSLSQLASAYDAVLFLSVMSGRNPEHLIGQHVHAAPMIRRFNLEPIPTAYLLIESGRMNTAQYMNGSPPIPGHKPDIAATTALAAEMLGMKLVFTDGGSGAERPVSEEMISAITETVGIPLVVGGGIRTPNEVARKVEAGASFVVIGNAIEQRTEDAGYISELAEAAHANIAHPLARS
ncbi:MAG: geranylgeranylglyceryl/heptaprenylglyceryl phosphate synthase [Rubricoccaceae bacterium]|nr:geranylgeranylglyceryl/heptaprenylglyceryl phosphate synthase [Rubricoccaceae bacterium]